VFVCKLVVAVQKNDAGQTFNDVKQITMLKTETQAPNPFAIGTGETDQPEGGDGTDFNFGANAGGAP
jgi:hypothetical protein